MHIKNLTLSLASLLLLILVFPAQSLASKPAEIPPLSLKVQKQCNAASTASVKLYGKDAKNLKLAKAFILNMEDIGRDPGIVRALYRASIKTNVDFKLLLLKVMLESDMGRTTIAKRSSARGIFQYIRPTWLRMIKRHGAEIGHANYAHAIKVNTKTGMPYFSTKDQFLGSEILALRHDPDTAALIKAYQILDETKIIKTFKKGKRVTTTDHYITHMLGLTLAQEFYDLLNKDSVIAVARIRKPEMREAAKLNRLFFYDKRTPLVAKDVYKRFERRVAQEMKRLNTLSKNVPIKTARKNCATAIVVKASVE